MSAEHNTLLADPELELQLHEPRLYLVILLNDDYTTMDFVIDVLQRFFNKTYQQAEILMLQIHEKGSAPAGIYPREIAEMRVQQVIAYARENGYPLMAELKPH